MREGISPKSIRSLGLSYFRSKRFEGVPSYQAVRGAHLSSGWPGPGVVGSGELPLRRKCEVVFWSDCTPLRKRGPLSCPNLGLPV